MNNSIPSEPTEVNEASTAGALGSNLARATLPPELHQQGGSGPQMVLDGLRGNGRIAGKVLCQIEAAIEATTAVWDAERKKFVDRPDYKTRLSACELFMAYGVGLPLQRSENLNINAQAQPPESTEDQLSKSPGARQAMRRILEGAEARAAKKEADRRAVRAG